MRSSSAWALHGLWALLALIIQAVRPSLQEIGAYRERLPGEREREGVSISLIFPLPEPSESNIFS